MVFSKLKLFAKRLFYPGFDLNTRSRYRWLPKYFKVGKSETLDAGCGNGALSYAAYKKGSNVLGVSYDDETNSRTSLFFRSHLNQGLQFKTLNLYNLLDLKRQFDQIICSETLEHIKDDRLIISFFYQLLKPKGVLHLCCPYALHPANNLWRVDGPEDGGHVRDGYTFGSYKDILEREGFAISDHLGLGSEELERCDSIVRNIRNRYGDLAAVPFFLAVVPFMRFIDKPNPPLPFSLYVKAVKVGPLAP